MISDKQLAANRANAQHSSGPSSAEGKRTSSLNALRHGLTGQVTAMTHQDRAAHDKFSDALIKSMAPEGALELQLAQRVATDSWRLNRASAIEDNLFALGFSEHADDETGEHPEIHSALTAAKTFTAQSKHFELITLYEQRINRSLQKNLALLQTLHAARKEQHRQEMEETKAARKLPQLSEVKNLPHDAAGNGFVFSNDQIHAAPDRERRLGQTQNTDFPRQEVNEHRAEAA